MSVASYAAVALSRFTLSVLCLSRPLLDHLCVGVGFLLMLLLGGLVALDCGHWVVCGVSLAYHVGRGCGGQLGEVSGMTVCGIGGLRHGGGGMWWVRCAAVVGAA